MNPGSQRHWRLVGTLLFTGIYIGLSYAMFALRDEVARVQVLAGVAQTGAFLVAFLRLLAADGLAIHATRGLLVAGGLLFSSLLFLYAPFGSPFFSWWYASMPQWGGWLIALGLLSWLPSRSLSVRAAARQGWQSEWFAWTSSLLVLAALYAATMGIDAWEAEVAAQASRIMTTIGDAQLASVSALAGFFYCAITLSYVRFMPRLLPRRLLLWTVLFLVGAVLVALPLIIDAEGLSIDIRRLAAQLLRHWATAPLAGRAVLFAAILGLLPRSKAAQGGPSTLPVS